VPQPVRASVVIVNYRAAEKLAACLTSIRTTGVAGAEVIVVDNDSRDGSVDALESAFPDASFIRSDRNIGFGAGSNAGARAARGEYLVFLNPDTRVERGWLEALLAPLEADPRAGLSTAKILLMDEPDRINTCGNDVHVTGLTLCRGYRQPRERFRAVEEIAAVSGAAFAVRRDTFESLGGFDESFFLYVEDTDLSWRARLAGWKCVSAPESVVYHHYSFRLTPRKVYYEERNRYQMLVKSLRWRTLVLLAPALLLAEVVTWGFVLLRDRGHAANKVRAYGWTLAHLPSLLAKRRAVQTTRRARDRELLEPSGYALDVDQASGGFAARAARAIFDPLFRILRGFVLKVVRW
jgi:hypothetical protein